MSCQHENFESDVAVGRIAAEEDGDIVIFVADVRVKCVDCGESFGFRGLPPGMSWGEPTRTVDALEACLPLLSPSDLALSGPLPGLSADPPPPPMPGFGITVR